MISNVPSSPFNPLATALDRILAEVAFSVQLPPTLFGKAGDRYRAVREYLERTDLFRDAIEHFYPQGSMAIDGTITNRGTDDEYDIDIVAQLGDKFRDKEPDEVLDDLFEALEGYRGLKVKRQTRCVTVYYADGMHLDITPSFRDANTPDRQSVICHAKGPGPSAEDDLIPMNAYGFVEWYKARTPIELDIVRTFDRRWRQVEASMRADADIDEVPPQTAFVVKNTATLALQLLKRYRNIRYANYSGRIPPSVLLSYYAAVAASPNKLSLTEMLIKLCRLIARDIRAAGERGQKVFVANPTYGHDVFTDRWPENLKQQSDFARMLIDLADGLENAHTMQAYELQDWLRKMFGERVVSAAADRMAKDVGQAIRHTEQSYTPAGKIVIPAAAAMSIPSLARAAPPAVPHTFHGKKLK